jgi:glycosyltransferase involved in cell wall biosynthesis
MIKNSMPLVTVITVVRNGEKTLENTIRSVLCQTCKNIEYLIVDGESVDGTLDIIRSYENGISRWASEKDNGIYDAMNKGIDWAQGEWIIFMNSGDTFYSENVVAEASAYFDEACDIVYGDACYNGKNISRGPKRINTLFFLMEHMICHQSIFARTVFLKDHFDTQYGIVADREWLMSALKKGAVSKHISATICNYDYSGMSTNVDDFHADSEMLVRNFYGVWGMLFIKAKRILRSIVKLNRPYNYDLLK